MNILIFSDTHGNTEDPIEIIRKEPEVNAIIHAGDCEQDAVIIQEAYPNIPVYSVPGNCDILSNSPTDRIIELDSKKILITHGHTYRVKYGLSGITAKAVDGDFDLVVFGHTHISTVEYYGKSIIVNPGSIKGYRKSYAKAIIKNGDIKVSIEEA